MEKEQLLAEINQYENEISDLNIEKRNLEGEYEDVIAFKHNCERERADYEKYLQGKKTQVTSISDLEASVRSAFLYGRKMREVLEGKDYINAIKSLDNLVLSINRKKNEIIERIEEVDSRLAILRDRIEFNNEDIRHLEREEKIKANEMKGRV